MLYRFIEVGLKLGWQSKGINNNNDEQIIWSEEGQQQGDPLSPLLFCPTVQPLLNSLQSPLVAGFMDDFTLGGPKNVVDRDIAVVTSTSTSMGLHLNVATCELVHP